MTTLTVDAHREQMLALLNAGRPYDFLNMAVAYLKVCADDDFVRLMAVREYLALNLTVPARFSYRATMDRFLHAMADHLQAAARS
jgi:hypothetical protein